MSLKASTIKGAFWSFGELFATKGANFAIQIILARLLTPEAFGLIAMMMVVIAIGDMFVDSGITSSLIRTKEVTEVDYASVFFMNVLLSILIYVTVYFLAPYIAEFYEQSSLVDLIRVFTLVIPIKSFMIVQQAILTRKMDFKTQMIIQTPSLIVSGFIGIGLAYYGYGVWSLVLMQVIQALLMTLQYWFYSSWRPKFLFDLEIWKKHFIFGYKLTLSYVVNMTYTELYNVVIGKVFSAKTLGLYNRAYTLQNLPGFIFHRAMNKVTLPLYSSIQDDNNQIRSALKKLTSVLLIVFFSIMGILYFNAEEVIYIVFGKKWIEMIAIFKVLIISGIFLPLYAYNYNILVSKGKSTKILIGQSISKILGIIGVFYFINIGLYPLLYFLVFTNFLNFLIFAYMAGKEIDYKLGEQLYSISKIFGFVLSLCIAVNYVVNQLYLIMDFMDFHIIHLFFYFILYCILFMILSETLKFEPYLYFKKTLKEIYLSKSSNIYK